MPTSTPDNRSRRAGVDRAQREQELLAAAQSAFVTHGYHGASMDVIAGLAGISKPIVYQFFTGKLDLYQAAVELRAEELFNRLKSVVEGAESSEQWISDVLEEFFLYVEEEEESFLLLADSGDRNGPQLRDGQDGISKALTDFMAPIISSSARRSQEEGRLIGRALVTCCASVALEWLKFGKITPREELAADIADVAWNGLRRRLGTGPDAAPPDVLDD